MPGCSLCEGEPQLASGLYCEACGDGYFVGETIDIVKIERDADGKIVWDTEPVFDGDGVLTTPGVPTKESSTSSNCRACMDEPNLCRNCKDGFQQCDDCVPSRQGKNVGLVFRKLLGEDVKICEEQST